ncbi:hypothetical protein [Synechococcus sp. CS-1332]|uniref:hypothetical protein n=1 Tax=Synechococcus sp. CS-1332 TaxID=2847972 RepID=UPI00223BCB74|nr:hypothetical protein [Synechococcus sp. CS-1332]MCT0208001.1 hypothetical protein [Synechococcus sp. CS-1332]
MKAATTGYSSEEILLAAMLAARRLGLTPTEMNCAACFSPSCLTDDADELNDRNGQELAPVPIKDVMVFVRKALETMDIIYPFH